MFRIITSIDKNAFVTQVNVNRVYGEGFDEYKVKMKHMDEDETQEEAAETAIPAAATDSAKDAQ